VTGELYPGSPERTWTTPLYTTATKAKPPGAHYDELAADRVIGCKEHGKAGFVPSMHHYKGDFGPSPAHPTGRPFDLLPWQEHEVFRPLFGWKTLERLRDADGMETDEFIPCSGIIREDGSVDPDGPACTCPRLYRTLYLETAKKNGKTQIGAAIGGYMAFGDGEAAAEVFCYAADKDNAKLAFDAMAFGMGYEGNPFAARNITFMARTIKNTRTKSKVEVKSSDASRKHGPNAHCIIFDELHAQPNRELWDVTTAGVIARRQPLVAALTTAGWDRESVCWEQHEHARQVAEGIYDDDRFLGVVYGALDDEDWTDPEVWHKAAPSLGITVSVEAYEQACLEAKQMPLSQNSFRQLFLSQWTQQAVRYIPLDAWDRCNAEPVVGKKRLCYGGIDLSATTDLSAFALVFPNREDGSIDVLVKYYMPEENLRQKSLRDRVPYEQWVKDGLITTTPGHTIKYDYIKADVIAAKNEYDLREIGYDPWNAVEFQQWMEREHIKNEAMVQGYKSFTAPTKELLRLVLEQDVRHGGNPVLRWNVDSAAAEMDAAGNVKLNKAKSSARIDGLIAIIMAFHAYLENPFVRRRSIYERSEYDPGQTSEEAMV